MLPTGDETEGKQTAFDKLGFSQANLQQHLINHKGCHRESLYSD